MSSSSKPNSSRGKTIAWYLQTNASMQALLKCFLPCCTVHRDVLCISIMRFLCEQATLWNSSEICFIFFFWNQFSARCCFRVCQRQRAYRRPSRGALSRGRASAGADARRQRGPTARVPSANLALRLLSSDSSVAVWENFKTKSQPLV